MISMPAVRVGVCFPTARSFVFVLEEGGHEVAVSVSGFLCHRGAALTDSPPYRFDSEGLILWLELLEVADAMTEPHMVCSTTLSIIKR
jgi:hypothetical protein